MATINSLAPETLICILELVGEHDLDDTCTHPAALKALAAASLVAQTWR